MNIAYCGLYCEACNKFIRKKCTGCYSNDKAAWCEIRKCCREHGYATCADCQITSVKECKKHNNVFARIISFIGKSDRSKCIDRIKETGIEKFAEEMNAKGIKSIRR